MVDREVKLAHTIRETCRRIRPDNPAIRQDILELIDDLDEFLECLMGDSGGFGLPQQSAD